MFDEENKNGFDESPRENDSEQNTNESNNVDNNMTIDGSENNEAGTDNSANVQEDNNTLYRYSYSNQDKEQKSQQSGDYGFGNENGSSQNNNYNSQQGGYSSQNSNYSSQPGGYNSQNGNYNSSHNEPPKKKKIRSSVVITVVVAAFAILVVGVFVTVGVIANGSNNGSINKLLTDGTNKSSYKDIGSTETESDDSKDSSDNTSKSTSGVTVTDVSSVVDNAMPSVVAITSKTLVESNNYSNDIFDYYFGGGNNNGSGSQQYEQDAAGSGIIVDQTDTELLIVTNNHVISGADSLKIQFYGEDTKSTVDGYIKGTDANADIAIVAVKLKDISNDTLKNIKKATIGNSESLKVGEGVIAIGNALGYGQSVTTGVISAKDREVTIEEKTMKLLQTDAAINGGNSGGALINSKGEVIGINVAKYSASGTSSSASVEGMGFAIPISSVTDKINELETRETRTKVSSDKQGYLGITGKDISSEVATQYSMPAGVYVSSVSKNGPAENAGIVESDVITKFDGETISSMSDLQGKLEYYKSGEKVKVTISYRDGRSYKEKEVTVKLGDKSAISSLENETQTQTQSNNNMFGY